MSRAYLECIEKTCRQRQGLNKKGHICDFCGGLLDVSYEFNPIVPESLRHQWCERLLSHSPIDRSGLQPP